MSGPAGSTKASLKFIESFPTIYSTRAILQSADLPGVQRDPGPGPDFVAGGCDRLDAPG